MAEPVATEPTADFEIPAGILRSRAALRRDLPALLASWWTRGKWVCYAGDTRIGIGRHYFALIEKCVGLGIPDDGYIIERIEPGAGSDVEEEIESRR